MAQSRKETDPEQINWILLSHPVQLFTLSHWLFKVNVRIVDRFLETHMKTCE